MDFGKIRNWLYLGEHKVSPRRKTWLLAVLIGNQPVIYTGF